MRIDDLRHIPTGGMLSSDICIVGSGPAALTIATEFAGTSHEVLVIESGSRDREDAFAIAQNRIESVGEPRVLEQQKVRNRILGGASHTWSGRCTTLDSIDYEPRDWVPFSGWPLDSEDMVPFVHRAAQYLGLLPADYDDALFKENGLPRRFDERDGTDVRTVWWQFSRHSAKNTDHMRFGRRFQELEAANVHLLTHATVTNIATDEGGSHVRTLEVATPEGILHPIRSRLFILCAGGIENPRILLASNRIDPGGVGNRHDLVGRFLMDHPRAVIGTFSPQVARSLQSEFFLLHHPSGFRMQRGLSLSLDVQRKEKLLNCAAWITQHFAHDDAWHALRTARLAKGRRRLARVAVRHADQIANGMWSRYVHRRPLPRRFTGLDLDVLVEQTPDPNSRLTLSDSKDALGIPISRIDWKIGDLERRTVVRLGHAINAALAGARLPQATLVDWVRDNRPQDAVFRDVAHPLGATRMADSPLHGVVDRNGKVFGIDNLYVAGSSVFPTGGHANPTLMIVALSLRLAETLARGVLEAAVS